MSWITIIWSAIAGICFALAGMYLLHWLQKRDTWESLLFSISAAASGIIALSEQVLMHAQTAAQYGEILRWMHLPAAVIAVALLWFLHLYLKTGRTWLVWLFCAVRVLVLVVNFVQEPNFNFREITGLRQVAFWGEMFSLPVGMRSPWAFLTRVGDLLLLIFVADASIAAWKKGDGRRAFMMGGAIFLAVVLAGVFSVLMNRGILPGPFVSVVYMFIIFVMAGELSREASRASLLSHELRETQARMLLATDAADLGLWEWDIVRDEIWLNKVSRARLGAGESERIDFNRFLQSLHPEDRESIRKAIQRSLDGDGELEAEYRIVTPNGTARWIAVRGHVKHGKNEKTRLFRGVSMDVTDRMQAANERIQLRNELAHFGRIMTISELSASLAHEINQPLGAIMNNAKAAQVLNPELIRENTELGEILADIGKDALRASEVVRKIRTIVKKEEVKFERLNLNVLIESVVELYRNILNKEKISVVMDLQPDLAPVRGDQVRLHQVIMNLITNASEAMRESPAKALTIRSIMQSPDRITVSVSDSGPGVDDAVRDKVFQPFFTTKKDGLGMGLRISRTIIEDHGGRIWVENNPTAGATFYISLNTDRGESQ